MLLKSIVVNIIIVDYITFLHANVSTTLYLCIHLLNVPFVHINKAADKSGDLSAAF